MISRVLSAFLSIVLAAAAQAQTSITMASTTSTEQSGLFSHLLPEFKKATGIDVKVVAVGTGQAIDIARRGNGAGCYAGTIDEFAFLGKPLTALDVLGLYRAGTGS